MVTLLCLLAGHAQAQKTSSQLLATYVGGHFCYFELSLYSDSTYRYLEAYDFMPIVHREHGIFYRTDTSIALLRHRRFAFMRSKPHRYDVKTYRLFPDRILMYTKAEENSADADFIKTYYTLVRAKE
jgi:hypothetical protein